MTFLCVSFYFKGQPFLRALKAEGHTVLLLTHAKLKAKAWPWESIDEVFYLEKDENTPENIGDMIKGLAWLMRSKKIDAIVALDDFDVEKAAAFREEFRIPGMGQTTARYFRDKLAMRLRAADAGIPVPTFTSLFHDEDVNRFADTVPAPWVLKPRSEASAMGIRKVHGKDELWGLIHALGDRRHGFLLEQFKPGDVYHVDALTFDKEVRFAWVSRYLNTPFEVAHGGGIFRSATCSTQDPAWAPLQDLNKQVMAAFGMRHSASHTEFIHCHEDGKYYFLETSSRVGGAHLNEMVEAATGINLWAEWARIESAAASGKPYQAPEPDYRPAGILVSLANTEHPDTSGYTDPEIVWTMTEPNHIGFIVRSADAGRVRHLLDSYMERVYREAHGTAPLPDKPTH